MGSVSPEKLCDFVMSMDLSFLNLDTLEKLEKLQPPPPELAILKGFTAEDVSVLSGVREKEKESSAKPSKPKRRPSLRGFIEYGREHTSTG